MQHGIDFEDDRSRQPGGSPRANIVFIAFIAIAAFYLIVEHRAHLWSYWPFLIVLACPLLHYFMHGGHKGRNNDEDRNAPPSASAGHRH